MLLVHVILWLYLTSLTLAILEEHQYCSVRYRRLCQGKGRHIACQFPDAGPGPSCRKYTAIRFTTDLKHFITNFINRRRQRIAAGNERVRGGVHLPKPQIMMLVEWDRELASLAQRLADQCNFIHDDCRATVRYPYAGQTVGEVRWRRTSESDEQTAQRAIRRVLDAWWGERRRVAPKQLTGPFRLTTRGTVWGHFSQLAVWNLQAVGCGAVRHGSLYSRLLLVCDFSHTNMLGQRTLVPGPQAPCPIHTARRPRTPYTLLCAPVRYQIPHGQDDIHAEIRDYNDEDIEDDEHEEEDRVEVADAPTPGHRKPDRQGWLKDTREEILWSRDDEETPLVKVLPTQKRIIVENQEQDAVEARNTEKYQQVEDARREWHTRKTYFERWREDHEKAHDMAPARTLDDPGTTLRAQFNPQSPKDEVIWDHSEPRHRWKQTRNRPQRPGANALLTYPSTAKQSRKPVVSSLMLDKDDIAQLFQDTGFSPNWKKPST